MNKPKKKRCKRKGCGEWFTPTFSTTQSVCSPICSYKHELWKKEEKNKERRKLDKKRLDELRPASHWANKAQTACNRYIRERDKDEPCISCGTTNNVKYDAGHYLARGGRSELRFHPSNIHKQCSNYCNKNLSGNQQEYRPRLIKKVGIEMVEYLENFKRPQRLTIADFKEIEQHFKDEYKRIK